MIVRSSVVLPTPLRPSTTCTSPGPTERSTSSRTIVDPYPLTTSVSCSMIPPQVDVEHALVGPDLVDRSGGQDRATMHHRDGRIHRADELHVVFDDHDRAVLG